MHRHQEPEVVRIYIYSLNTNSVFLAVLGKGENFTNCKTLSRQVCVLLKSPIPDPRAARKESAVTALHVPSAL